MRRSTLFLFLAYLCMAATTFGFEVIVINGTAAGTPTRWGSSQFPVGYSIHNAGTQGVSASAVGTQFSRVIGIINNQSPLKFKNLGTTTSVVGGDRLNGVIFDKNFTYGSFLLAIQRLGSSSLTPNQFTEGDLVFNDKDYNWTVNASSINNKTYNVFSVMMHEMGHGSGLNHSAIKTAVMFFQFQKDVTGLALDDKTGIKYVYKNPPPGTLPKLVTPINNSIHTFSTVGQAARVLTFRWRKSQFATSARLQVPSTYTLVFAADSAFTKSVTRYSASDKLAYLISGTKLARVQNIQAASATKEVFWRVEEKNGTQILKSATFRFKIA